MTNPISEERLRNTRAWAAARLGTLSGADVIVGAIDELLARRQLSKITDAVDADVLQSLAHEPGDEPGELRKCYACGGITNKKVHDCPALNRGGK